MVRNKYQMRRDKRLSRLFKVSRVTELMRMIEKTINNPMNWLIVNT
jgi:hypothetical protein